MIDSSIPFLKFARFRYINIEYGMLKQKPCVGHL